MAPSVKRTKRNTGPWSSLRILNSASPVLKKDIHGFLVTCISGWHDRYNEAEKRAIIDSMPPPYRQYELDDSGALVCPISVDFVLNDPHVRAAISRFKQDVSEGFYEKGWQNQARKAVKERQAGKFDTYLHEHVEEKFGEQATDNHPDRVPGQMESNGSE
ncbi:hypothetical protein HRR83_009018 [Exophiala dermatitidis]|uniref:ASX DEUBAD domain-containing protein n=1 Tax=Exophiala dermatitidis TaxID=5970 RepID=A0AAN6EKL0_EXODE|nr:hypothetical protein HRR75_008330 [Exophiala dermatitidis]KAJ4503445.1 hypothetical protein HRR73_009070 [Exophiala dermatitidis]KAJ4504047.1 hypothetical protein HRR74_009068 [Exophiala dermatitidis]KAJ4528966.1 hypothetical protein HRR76_009579 [Exophiala dermatitidis]KAJ4533192.1 hypothetical protein HRR77_008903 [Exophiala dermatitidis]